MCLVPHGEAGSKTVLELLSFAKQEADMEKFGHQKSSVDVTLPQPASAAKKESKKKAPSKDPNSLDIDEAEAEADDRPSDEESGTGGQEGEEGSFINADTALEELVAERCYPTMSNFPVFPQPALTYPIMTPFQSPSVFNPFPPATEGSPMPWRPPPPPRPALIQPTLDSSSPGQPNQPSIESLPEPLLPSSPDPNSIPQFESCAVASVGIIADGVPVTWPSLPAGPVTGPEAEAEKMEVVEAAAGAGSEGSQKVSAVSQETSPQRFPWPPPPPLSGAPSYAIQPNYFQPVLFPLMPLPLPAPVLISVGSRKEKKVKLDPPPDYIERYLVPSTGAVADLRSAVQLLMVRPGQRDHVSSTFLCPYLTIFLSS